MLLNLLLAALSLAFVCAAAETAARLVVGRSVAPKSGTPNRPISRYSPTLGWDKPPGGEMRIARDEYDVLIRINSKGLRGPERDYAKAAGARRVLILGDSFAEGYYVDEDKSARAVLEGLLNGRDACSPFDVVNGGTAGYSTDQEYLFFEEEGHKYSPDLVLVFFYYNDVYYNSSGIGTGGKPKPYFDVDGDRLVLRNTPVPKTAEDPKTRVGGLRPWRGSIALRLLSNRTLDAAPRLHASLARLGLVEPVSRDPYKEFWPYGAGHREEVDDMWRRTAVILKALKERVESHGGRLAGLYVPSRLDVNEEALEAADQRFRMGLRRSRDRVAKRLKATCDAIGIPLADPREALRRQEASGTLAYFPNDGHWNEIGNAIAARELLPLVKTILPCGGAPR